MTIEIDYDKAIELLKRAVAEKGADYVYERPDEALSCVYVSNGAPSCIVGHVISYVAPELLDSIHIWEQDAFAETGSGVESLVEHFGAEFDMTDEALTALGIAQEAQDMGANWGRALGKARYDD